MINFLIGVLSVVTFMTIYVWFRETSDNEYNYKTKRKMKDKMPNRNAKSRKRQQLNKKWA